VGRSGRARIVGGFCTMHAMATIRSVSHILCGFAFLVVRRRILAKLGLRRLSVPIQMLPRVYSRR
jgi:hypothetical protein